MMHVQTGTGLVRIETSTNLSACHSLICVTTKQVWGQILGQKKPWNPSKPHQTSNNTNYFE